MTEVTTKPKRWLSAPPTHCEVCRGPIQGLFYDMRTKQGPWALMCLECATEGLGINKTGPGCGQKYALHTDLNWYKVEG